MARSSNQPDRQALVEASGLSDGRVQQLPPGSDKGRRGSADLGVQTPNLPLNSASPKWEPRSPRTTQPSVTFPQTPVDESRFHSRVARRAKKVRFPVQELKKWEVWCTVHHIAFQDVATDAIRKWFAGSPGAQEPRSPQINDLDDLIDDGKERTISSSSDQLFDPGSPGAQTPELSKENAVMTFYQAKTGNRIRLRDRWAYNRGHHESPGVVDVPLHLILYGIMASILNCKSGRVNSFAYCLGAIDQAAESETPITEQVTDFILRTYDARLERKLRPEMGELEVRLKKYDSEGRQPTLPSVGADLEEFEK